MGSGKSFIGEKLAEKLAFQFIDLDDFIEKKEQRSINNIFEEDGEKYFRKTEQACLKTLEKKTNLVVATGGGTPCFFDNMNWMNQQGITIYLQSSVALLAERLKNEKEQRPLLKGLNDKALKAFIKNKITERKAFYEKAKFTIYQRRNDDSILNRVISVLDKI